MTTNFYFNNFTNSQEQTLVEDLIIESIRIYGHDVFYIPRNLIAIDDILNEDDLSTFTNAYMIEMYIKQVDGFEGDGDFLSKFGLTIKDSITFSVAMRSFENEVASNVPSSVRPNEGDLIYFPLNKKIFEIKHVEHEAIFYQMGSLQTYDLRAELFDYSFESIKTDNSIVDDIFSDIDTTSANTVTDLEKIDPIADNKDIQDEADKIMDWDESNPFGRW